MAIYIENRKAKFHYEIGEVHEAGIELFGFEVKSVKAGRGNFDGAYVVIRGGEVFLVGASIPPYQANNVPTDYEAERVRKLLLNKNEILKLQEIERARSLTLVPLALYNKGRVLKVSVAEAKGKKAKDKRQTIRRREDEREMHRTLKKLR